MMENVINVPTIGEDEIPQAELHDWKLKEVLGGVRIPSQAFSKAMARCILNMRLGVDPSSPVKL